MVSLEGPGLALLRRKTLVSFGWSELTFVERPECERLTLSGPLRSAAFHNAPFRRTRLYASRRQGASVPVQ